MMARHCETFQGCSAIKTPWLDSFCLLWLGLTAAKINGKSHDLAASILAARDSPARRVPPPPTTRTVTYVDSLTPHPGSAQLMRVSESRNAVDAAPLTHGCCLSPHFVNN
jgi:hypothetical protein